MTTDTETADVLSKRRATMMPVVAILIFQQLIFARDAGGELSLVLLVSWAALALIGMVFLLTGGFWFRSRKVRDLINDEISKENRHKGLAAAFAGGMLTSILVFVAAPYEPISAQMAAHLIFSVSLGMGLIVFALNERKALG